MKNRLRKSEKSPDKTSDVLPTIGSERQMSMVGVQLHGSAKSRTMKHDFPARSFLPADLGRKHLVQSPETTSRSELLLRAKKLRERVEQISPVQQTKLPNIGEGLSVSKTGTNNQKIEIDDNFPEMRGSVVKTGYIFGDSEDKITLPKLKRTGSSDVGRNSPDFQMPAVYHGSGGVDGRAKGPTEIEKGLISNDTTKLPELRVKQNNLVSTCGRNVSYVGTEDRQLCLKQRKQMFLPNLSQNCELSTNGNIMEGNYSINSNEVRRQSRKSSRKIKSGQKSASERRRELLLSSPLEALQAFEDELVGTSCPKSKREKRRKKSALPSLKSNS